MKTFLIALSFLTLLGCGKDNGVNGLKYLGVTPGGCNNGHNGKSAMVFSNDTVWYFIRNDSLDIHFGYHASCCGSYNTSYLLKSDTIFIAVTTSQYGQCNCICYYTFDFKFHGINKPYLFSINLDNYKRFQGKINNE